jgi:kynurenine 3-monooxygenase
VRIFASLEDRGDVALFFEKNFPDSIEVIPNLTEDFSKIQRAPWSQ